MYAGSANEKGKMPIKRHETFARIYEVINKNKKNIGRAEDENSERHL